MRSDRPSYRARMALNRLSRDRWISGPECKEIVSRWVGNSSAYKAAIEGCEYVGIIRGRPPAYIFESHYRDVYKAVTSGKSDTEIMIKLLTILSRRQ